jgi:predicted RNA-binding protein YlxR (DUF448 family)
MSEKTPNRTSGYFAVRKGKGGIQKCVFLDYDDCKAFVEDDSTAEYHVFDTFVEAETYLRQQPTAQKPSLQATKKRKAVDINNDEPTLTPMHPAAKAAAATALASIASPVPPAHKKARPSEVSFVERKSYRPTKKWQDSFLHLKAFVESGNVGEMDAKLKTWTSDQRYQYSLLQQNKPSTMTEEKIQRFKDIGYALTEAKPQSSNLATATKPQKPIDSVSSTPTNKQSRQIYKRWHYSFDRLKEYMNDHNGSWGIDTQDKENSKLRVWIADQQQEYRKMSEGQDSAMNQEKLQLLQSIGFTFSYAKWQDRLSQLQAYKHEHADFCVPNDHPVLGKWFVSLKRHCKEFSKTGTPTREMNAQRMEQLKAIGFDPGQRKNSKPQEEETADWEANLEKLKQYKLANGDCSVPRTDETLGLFNWIVAQRSGYKRLQQGKSSKLTASHLMRLNDLGFVFLPKGGSYRTWNDRVEELRQFMAQHGHLNVTTTHAELGEFVSRQRNDYRKRLDGLQSPMTDEKCQILTELGFNFDVGQRRKDRSKINPVKSWEERFQELLDFKQIFGHTVVPQHSTHTPGLGAWVKQQRNNYKKLKKGQKCSMTAEKALKLANVGFVFDVRLHEKKPRREEDDEE